MTDTDRIVRRLHRKEGGDFIAEVQEDVGMRYPPALTTAPVWIATERGVEGYGVTADQATSDLRGNPAHKEGT